MSDLIVFVPTSELSVAKIVPVRVPQQSSQMRNLATSFGVDFGGFNHSSSLTSAEMFPSLIESRSLAESLLEKRFSNKKFGENKSLISILLNSSKDHENWSYKQKKSAVDELLRKISVTRKKRSPLLTLTAVTKEIGPHSKPDKIQFTAALPKTRSGKIMRRILRKIAEGDLENLGDISTLADPSVVQNLTKESL